MCHKTDIVKHTDTVITASFMLLHPFMSHSQLARELRILMLLTKADFLSCFGSDAHEPLNHLFLGSACESRREFVLRLGAIAFKEKT